MRMIPAVRDSPNSASGGRAIRARGASGGGTRRSLRPRAAAYDNAVVIAIGMMSGTSADGVDLAAIDIEGAEVRLVSSSRYDYPEDLRERVLRAAAGEAVGAAEIAALHVALGDSYAEAAAALVGKLERPPELIAVRGQTVTHVPARHATLQLGDASRVGIRPGITP